MAEKKKFFKIDLPLINKKVELYSTTEEKLAGRTIKIDFTRKLRGKSLEAIYKVEMQKDKVTAVPYRLHLLGYFIRRMMRKSTDYVEDSFPAECKNASLRIKPFLITRRKVSRAVRKALRNKAKEEIGKVIKEKKYEEIFSDIMSNKFQRSLSLKLKKIYPLALCEIRDIYIEKPKAELEVQEEKVK
jgi:ribosomal protein S3AE